MCFNGRSISLPMNKVETNAIQGVYRPAFFDLSEFNLNRVDYSTAFYEEGSAEIELLRGSFSFCYLREDKLRMITAFDKEDRIIPFNEFTDRFGIKIRSKNLFKTGKYLSRVFRPVKYGKFFQGLHIHINNNPVYRGKVTDGISLVSVKLAKELGWTKADKNMSAQFTLFFKEGLVKGHCVLSDKIESDVVVYGNDNIKSEISLGKELQYITLEPVKLGKSLRMDIQSMLNLWQLFGAEQYLEWAYNGIINYQDDLFNGKLTDCLDDFDDIDVEEYDNEQWLLRKAIWHKIDYARYPGLIRLAWSMFRNSIQRFADKANGNPGFRIPVSRGKRGYIRVDLRDHDKEGNFRATVNKGEVCLDRLGNLWIHPEDAEEFLEIKGGADMDDAAAIIPVEDNKAVIYRNPNQYGEYGIHKIVYDGIEIKEINKIIGAIPYKRKPKTKLETIKTKIDKNKLINDLKTKAKKLEIYEDYTRANLLRTYTKISSNSANIGIAANAEMIRSVIGIKSKTVFSKLTQTYNWNLERIIDATVKDGTDCTEDMDAVRGLINYVVDNKIPMPESITHRFPEMVRKDVTRINHHPLDELHEAIKYIIEEADNEVLGKGTVSKNNRIPGRIDKINVPVIEIGYSNIDNPLNDLAINLLKDYNKQIAMLFTKEGISTNEEVEKIQIELLRKMSVYSTEERKLIVKSWAYDIYKSNRMVHDSILWITSKQELRGIAEDTIEMLSDIGEGYHVKKNGCVKRYYEIAARKNTIRNIRLWSKEEISVSKYTDINEIFIENHKAIIGEDVFPIGDECEIEDGIFEVSSIVNSISKRNNTILKNSLSVALSL